MSHPRFQLHRGRNGKFFFNLSAKNGQTILQSEGYASRIGARNGIKAVKACSKRAKLFERRTAKNGTYYFVLNSPNGQVVAKSQMYRSASGRANGLKSVMANASGAKVAEE